MRQGTLLFLLLLVLLFAVFGWKALGWVAVALASVVLLGILAGMVSLWLVRRRMRRAVRDLRSMLTQQHAAMQQMRGRGGGDVIDVEPESVRDDGPGNRPGP